MLDLWAVAIPQLVSILSQWRKGHGDETAVCMQVAVPRAAGNECAAQAKAEGCLD